MCFSLCYLYYCIVISHGGSEMKISYEYEVKKIAYLPGEKGSLVPIGVFEQSNRDGDICKMTVKLFPNLPNELVDLIKENPQVLAMKETKQKATTVVILPEAHDSLIISKV